VLRVASTATLLAAAACASSTAVTGYVPSPATRPTAPGSIIRTAPPVSAVAAARAYVDAYDRAAQTGDTTEYDRIVAPGCPCREPFLTSFVASLRAHHWHTDARRVITAVWLVRTAGAGAIVDVGFRVAPYRVLDVHGSTVMPGEPDHAVLRISLVRSDGRWVVADAVRR